MTSETMVCPECGRPMVLRTARRGRYAGRQFWGCTGYTASPPEQCKAIVNIPDDGFESSPVTGASSSSAQPDDLTGSTTSGSSPRGMEPDLNSETIPRQVSVQPNHTREQVRFFQACGLPTEYVNAIYQGETERELVRSAAQWRLLAVRFHPALNQLKRNSKANRSFHHQPDLKEMSRTMGRNREQNIPHSFQTTSPIHISLNHPSNPSRSHRC